MSVPFLCLVGGFLGAGKTTTILAAARRLDSLGLRTAIISNDQGQELVDALLVADAKRPLGSVEGGCFCCKFDALVEQLDRLQGETVPDVIFAEAVGSCTDLSATVLNPLRRLHPDRFRLAPITVVVEPWAVGHLLLKPSHYFSADLQYLFRKQLEEADVVLLNKSDASPATMIDEAAQALQGLNPAARVIRASAYTGLGLDEWLGKVRGTRPPGGLILDLDYGRYGAAEAQMGWLNARVRLEGGGASPVAFLKRVLRRTAARLDDGGGCVHLKAFLRGPRGTVWAARAMSPGNPSLVLRGDLSSGPWLLTLNLRALVDPREAQRIVENELREASAPGFKATLEVLHRFRPASPRPTFRDQ